MDIKNIVTNILNGTNANDTRQGLSQYVHSRATNFINNGKNYMRQHIFSNKKS